MKKWWQFWKSEQKNAHTLGVLIRQSGNFTSYNFSAYIREAYQQNTTVYACIQEYVKACASCPIIIKRGDTVIENKPLMTLLQTQNIS